MGGFCKLFKKNRNCENTEQNFEKVLTKSLLCDIKRTNKIM